MNNDQQPPLGKTKHQRRTELDRNASRMYQGRFKAERLRDEMRLKKECE
jgi:hypothetical protein